VTGPPEPTELALRALSYRDLSRSALAQRLAAAGAGDAAAILARLAEAGLVDDRRLAEKRAAALAGRGLGNAAIDARLESEGIERADRLAALAAIEQEQIRARRLARETGQRGRARVAGLLARRGFSNEAIEAALAALDGPLGAELG
jgi:SOS response regulatory protein OraA/RecX